MNPGHYLSVIRTKSQQCASDAPVQKCKRTRCSGEDKYSLAHVRCQSQQITCLSWKSFDFISEVIYCTTLYNGRARLIEGRFLLRSSAFPSFRQGFGRGAAGEERLISASNALAILASPQLPIAKDRPVTTKCLRLAALTRYT